MPVKKYYYFFMKKRNPDNKILLIGIIVTVLIIVLLFSKKINNPAKPTSTEQIESTIQTDQQAVSEQEQPIEEGLYLEVISPVDVSSVSNSSITVSGKTEANVEIFINENELKADLQGNFSAALTLEEGENIIVVTASDDEGNYAEKTVTVTYEPAS